MTDATPWAHVDMAGMMGALDDAAKEMHYAPKIGIGYGVRLFLGYLNSLE
ncbi:MAG: M17 family metallopeptidase [Anaerolineales bacterium]|nr:M17 family metallopeptidase [Anaerolineales bacterium]